MKKVGSAFVVAIDLIFGSEEDILSRDGDERKAAPSHANC
jgi:hypothetical protein